MIRRLVIRAAPWVIVFGAIFLPLIMAAAVGAGILAVDWLVMFGWPR